MSQDTQAFHILESSTAAVENSSPVPGSGVGHRMTPPRPRVAPQNPFEHDPATLENFDGSVSSGEGLVAPNSPTRSTQASEASPASSPTRNVSAPATPNQIAFPRIPQSAPPMLSSAPSNSLQPSYQTHPSSERRAPTDTETAFHRPPQQPVFDDDENTEPSSAANTSDYENKDQPERSKDMSTFSRLVQYTRRRLSFGKESDDEDDIVDGAVISGYLQKLGRNGKWQTRWFETDGECLSYYKSRKRTKLLATLDLEKVSRSCLVSGPFFS